MLVTLCQSDAEEIRKVASETLLALGESLPRGCSHEPSAVIGRRYHPRGRATDWQPAEVTESPCLCHPRECQLIGVLPG